MFIIEHTKSQKDKAMQVKILTSTMQSTKSTSKGTVTYSLSANEFEGYAQCNENGKTIERAKIGRLVSIAKSTDKAKLSKYIKQCRKAGDIVELQSDNIQYGI